MLRKSQLYMVRVKIKVDKIMCGSCFQFTCWLNWNFSWIRVLSGQVGGDFFKVDGSGSKGCIVKEGSGLFSLGKNWKWKWQKCILTKPLCLPWKVASKTFWRSWLNLLTVKSYRQPCRYQGEGLELKVQVTDISSWPHGYNASHGNNIPHSTYSQTVRLM